MSEHIRLVNVTIVVDTNKSTYDQKLTWQEDETRDEFKNRVISMLDELTEVS